MEFMIFIAILYNIDGFITDAVKDGMMRLVKAIKVSVMCLCLAGCGGGGGGGTTASTASTGDSDVTSVGADVAACPDGGVLSISGIISYERVPFSATAGNGLDYNNIQTLPVRGAVIQALGVGDCVITFGVTSGTGTYSLNVDANSSVKIRVKASTASTAGDTWDFDVRDNTSSNGLYVLDGSLVDSGLSNSTRNLTATSGWTGSSYGGVRAAGPFAILDSVYDSIQKVITNVVASVVFPAADIFWSVNNSRASGSLSQGEIGGSFYSGNQIYILGRSNSDTDEYDAHIVIHEWGHYFEDNLSRSDSIGGSHSIGQRLDMRVALSEGFGNAFSGMVTDDPIYRDSSGSQQGVDFRVDVETNAAGADIGWFSEASVQTILYDIYDATADANDAVALGFGPIYDAMTHLDYTSQPSRTSIFSLIDKIQDDNVGSSAAINALVTSQSITSIVDQYGTNETNNGGDANNLDVYKLLADDGMPEQVCSSKTEGEYNKLGNRQFLRLAVTSPGAHNIVATRVSGLASSDPDIRVYLNGSLVFFGSSAVVNSEAVVASNLNVDDYIIEVYEFTNIDSVDGTGGLACFNVTVS
ncbi:MAG: hypothetical protein ACJAZJ_000294 [Candidatus Endobugula sp.]